MMMFLAGILTWQAVAVIVALTTNNDDKCIAISCGVFALISKVISIIYNKILLFHCRKYNCYQFFGSYKSGSFLNGWLGNYYMTAKDAERFNLINRDATPEPYSVRLLREGREFKSAPYKSDILTAKKIENGVPRMSKDFIKKFFKRA